jgi:pantoate--beta-alanine ligase
MRQVVRSIKEKGLSIGLVPTMGYLHEGHLSLVRIARRKADFVVVSVFVNPTQFGPREDLTRYPRDIKRDRQLLRTENVDIVFAPDEKQMYPPAHDTVVHVEKLSTLLCGVSRPHHFRGVTTVVLKLFNIVQPDIAVFGRKDFQQAVIIRRMVADLDLDITIITGPIVRENDGLAMSSRNTYLTSSQRKNATVLHAALTCARRAYRTGSRDSRPLKNHMAQMIRRKKGRIDYIAVVHKDTLQPQKRLHKNTLIALAVYFGKTRLIDNTIL